MGAALALLIRMIFIQLVPILSYTLSQGIVIRSGHWASSWDFGAELEVGVCVGVGNLWKPHPVSYLVNIVAVLTRVACILAVDPESGFERVWIIVLKYVFRVDGTWKGTVSKHFTSIVRLSCPRGWRCSSNISWNFGALFISSHIDRYLYFLFGAWWLGIRSAFSTISEIRSALFKLLCNLGGLLIVIPMVFEEVGPALKIPSLRLLDITPLRIGNPWVTLLKGALIWVIRYLFTIANPVLKVEAWIFGRSLEMLSGLSASWSVHFLELASQTCLIFSVHLFAEEHNLFIGVFGCL